MQLSAKLKSEHLLKAGKEIFDLIVVGGGITGAGIALDAAARGLSVLLLEKQDFAAGTSSRSTKLIHGGLRYLKQGEFGLVREVGYERAIVHQNAPHLVIPEKMIIPLIKNGNFGKWATSFGLWVYDKLANVQEEDQRQMLTKEETLKLEPLLKEDEVIGSGYYAEYRTDDARLTIENLKKAAEYGAYCFNYAEVVELIYENNQINGVKITDKLNGQSHTFKSTVVINAAGPWVDELRQKDGSISAKRLHLTKGVHLVVPHSVFPVKQSVYFDVPDGRMIFAIPRQGITYIGTTDTDYTGKKENPGINKADVNYLIKAVNFLFPSIRLQESDIISSWSGLRPLIFEEGKSASEMSRKDEIFIAESGLISIAGGKLTGYRKMAQKVVDLAIKRHFQHKNLADSFTEHIRLTTEPFKDFKEVKSFLKSHSAKCAHPNELKRLVHTYGKIGLSLYQQALKEEKTDFEAALCLVEFDYCMETEMCCSLIDYYLQRSGLLYFEPQKVKNTYQHMLKLLEKYQNTLKYESTEEVKSALAKITLFID